MVMKSRVSNPNQMSFSFMKHHLKRFARSDLGQFMAKTLMLLSHTGVISGAGNERNVQAGRKAHRTFMRLIKLSCGGQSVCLTDGGSRLIGYQHLLDTTLNTLSNKTRLLCDTQSNDWLNSPDRQTTHAQEQQQSSQHTKSHTVQSKPLTSRGLYKA